MSGDAEPTRATAEPPLGSPFLALEGAGVRYAVLRGDQWAGPDHDLDVLVDPDHLETAARILSAVGYVSLPGWTTPTGRVVLAYDRTADQWQRLDLTTVLRFGRDRPIELDAVGCLARAVPVDGVRRPSAADEFWTLLLHDALDHPDGPGLHAARVAALGGDAAADDPIVREARGGPGWDPGALLEAGRNGRVDAARRLLEVGREARGVRPVRAFARSIGRAGRALRRAVARARRRVPVIVLDARTTNAPSIVAALPRALRPRLIASTAGTVPVRALAYHLRGDVVLLATTGTVAGPAVRVSPMDDVTVVATDAAQRSAMAQIWDACTLAWSRQGAPR